MTSASLRPLLCLIYVVTFALMPLSGTDAGSPAIEFDMAPLAVALPLPNHCERPQLVDVTSEETLVACELNLSSMIATPKTPQIDQWLIRCTPRDEVVMIADYHPRTEVASDLEGPIQIKKIDEESDAIGLAVDGAYGQLAHGKVGADRGQKKTDTLQYNQVAPVQAVTASGTIDRGRGVYFKLRWTASQVLEGEKKFSLTFRVPNDWRSGLVDVTVTAQSHHKSFPSWDDGVKTIGDAKFVVAVYRQGDREAAKAAQALAEAEQRLRKIASEATHRRSLDSVPSMLRYVARKFESEPEIKVASWVDRLIVGQADPYHDRQIAALPVDVRVAALDYCDARDFFASLK